MGIQPIPDSALEEVYQYAKIALVRQDHIEGLVEHFKQTSEDAQLYDESSEGFRMVLDELSDHDLTDLFYETAVSTSRYDPSNRTFFVDPRGHKGYALDGLYAHFYRESLVSVLGTRRVSVTANQIASHLSSVYKHIADGKGSASFKLGGIVLDLNPGKGVVHITHERIELAIPRHEHLALETALSQWNSRVKGLDIGYRNEEAFSL